MMKAKRLRQKIRKENLNILNKYVTDIKTFKLRPRLHIAWSIIKGKRWQAELLRFGFVTVVSLAIYGLVRLFEVDLMEFLYALVQWK